LNKLILSLILIITFNAKADTTEMQNKVQEAVIKTFKINEMLENYAKEFQRKHIPDEYVRSAVYMNFANDIFIKKQISMKWSF
jgi:hypothetical protein